MLIKYDEDGVRSSIRKESDLEADSSDEYISQQQYPLPGFAKP